MYRVATIKTSIFQTTFFNGDRTGRGARRKARREVDIKGSDRGNRTSKQEKGNEKEREREREQISPGAVNRKRTGWLGNGSERERIGRKEGELEEVEREKREQRKIRRVVLLSGLRVGSGWPWAGHHLRLAMLMLPALDHLNFFFFFFFLCFFLFYLLLSNPPLLL